MLNISNNVINIDLEFNGIKIINYHNSTLFYKEFLKDSIFMIDDKIIDKNNVIYINNLSTLKEFLNLNKKSFLFKLIQDLFEIYPVIDKNNILKIINNINTKFHDDFLDYNDGDISKIINLFFELNNEQYLNSDLFELILENQFIDRCLFIIDDISWINFEFISKFLNQHHFIILTNDFRKYINENIQLETLCIFNDEKRYFDVLDYNKLLSFLEQKLNLNIDNIGYYFKNNTFESQKIYWNLLNII